MISEKHARSIIMPKESYTKLADERKLITSLRVTKNPKIKKFEIFLVSDLEVVQKFSTKDLTIRVYKNEDINEDVLEFLNKNKKSIASVYMPYACGEEIYQKYIKAMMI